MGNRMSILDTTLYCPQAGVLSAKYGAGMAAAAGRYFHALDAGDPTAADKYERLDEEWQEKADSWKPVPNAVEFFRRREPMLSDPPIAKELPVLDKSNAVREREVRLIVGDFLIEEIVGHPDLYWDVPGLDLVVVLDIKLSSWTCAAGPASLQVQGYGMALTQELGRRFFLPGIWSASEGEAIVGDIVDTHDAAEVVRKLTAAGTNTEGEAVVGPHCHGCYARMHCPEYCAPLNVAESAVGPALTNAITNNEQALNCLMSLQAIEDMAKLARTNLRVYAERAGGIHDPRSHKSWGPSVTKGRESLDRAALVASGVDLTPFMKVGKPGKRFAWTNTRVF